MRVMVADDVTLFREGLVLLLRGAGVDVVAEARDATEAVTRAEHHRPDVVIMDVRMPPDHTDDGLRAAIRLKCSRPEMGVLMLTGYVETTSARRLLEESEGGIGYLLKDRVDDLATLRDALTRVAAGEPVIDDVVFRKLFNRRRREASALDGLTARESEVLRMMAEGRSNAGIAVALSVTEKTVESYVAKVFGRLGLSASDTVSGRNRRVLAVLEWLRSSPLDRAGPTA